MSLIYRVTPVVSSLSRNRPFFNSLPDRGFLPYPADPGQQLSVHAAVSATSDAVHAGSAVSALAHRPGPRRAGSARSEPRERRRDRNSRHHLVADRVLAPCDHGVSRCVAGPACRLLPRGADHARPDECVTTATPGLSPSIPPRSAPVCARAIDSAMLVSVARDSPCDRSGSSATLLCTSAWSRP